MWFFLPRFHRPSPPALARLPAPAHPPTTWWRQAKKFSRNAAAYAAFIIVLYFSMAAVWCMCYMPFKHDTLLYGSKKAE